MSEGLDLLRQGRRRRQVAEQRAVACRRARAWELARRGATLLHDDFDADRVVLYGSLARGDDFHLRSDVDLAAWGVHDYLRAIARLLDLDAEIELNLVLYEEISPGLQAAINREGVDLP